MYRSIESNILNETRIKVNCSHVCISCSSVVDCLVLIYTRSSPGVAYSSYITPNELKCSRVLENQLLDHTDHSGADATCKNDTIRDYSVAFYTTSRHDSMSSGMLERYPGKVDYFSSAGSCPTSPPSITSTLASSTTVSGSSLDVPNASASRVILLGCILFVLST